jgi:hypothetical protein
MTRARGGNIRKRMDALETEYLTRFFDAMTEEEQTEHFIQLDNRRRQELGLPLDVTMEERLQESREWLDL